MFIANSAYTSIYEIEADGVSLGLDSSIANRKVVVYRLNSNSYEYSQILEPFNQTEDFGSTIAVSQDGKKIAVGAPLNSDVIDNGGAVYIYIQSGNTFVYSQTLRPIDKKPNVQFGTKIDFDGNTLAVASRGGTMVRATSFDTYKNLKTGEQYVLDPTAGLNSAPSTFDNNSTKFQTIDSGSGVVTIYETINNTLLYSQNFTYNLDTQDFGNRMLVSKNHVYIGLPKQQVPDSSILDRGLVAEYRKPADTTCLLYTSPSPRD